MTEPTPLKPCPILFIVVTPRNAVDSITGNLIAFNVRLDTLMIAYSSTENCVKVR